jgi:hypothetical protein
MSATTATNTSIAPPEALVRAEETLLATLGIPVERHEVSVGGVRIHYLTCGEGEPLVLVHGRGNAGAHFAPIFAASSRWISQAGASRRSDRSLAARPKMR